MNNLPFENLPFLIDTHVHLTDEAFSSDLEEVLKRARAVGIRRMIVIAFDLPSSIAVCKLARKYEELYAAVGIHPCDASTWDKQTMRELENLLKQKEANKIVAVGEIGFDFHYDNVPVEPQEACFMEQIHLASYYDLPIIVHSRDAHEASLALVTKASQRGLFRSDRAGVFHCFSSSKEMAERLAPLGFYFGFDGPLTYKNARQAPLIVEQAPLDRLLIETDCPYLPPVPYRGKRNEPSYVIEVARKMAELRNMSLFDLARATSLNAIRLFGDMGLELSRVEKS